MSSSNKNAPPQGNQIQGSDANDPKEGSNLLNEEPQSKLVESLTNLFDDAAEQLSSLHNQDILKLEKIIEVTHEKYS